MKRADEILSSICAWAEAEESIRAAILIGSRAVDGEHDDLSDFDISLFTTQSGSYTQNDQWLSSIYKHWVCVHEKLLWKNSAIPTRLVIFEGGVKVDFAFYPTDALNDLSNGSKLPDNYDAGYKVLLDKDGLTKTMAKPSFSAFALQKPSQEEFERVVQEFWFEAYHVATYLKRDDLWRAKFREWEMKDPFLITMLRWHTGAKHGWHVKTHSQGKTMKSWIDESKWKDLHACFSHFEAEDSWKTLEQTISLFSQIALETADLLAYPYPEEVDRNLSQFIFQLKDTTVTP